MEDQFMAWNFRLTLPIPDGEVHTEGGFDSEQDAIAASERVAKLLTAPGTALAGKVLCPEIWEDHT
jgi:hypothetical protein